jgi:hypothetical protein
MEKYKTIHENKIMINPPKERQYSPLQRILRIIKFNYNRGCNKESVNKVYHKIIKLKYENRN